MIPISLPGCPIVILRNRVFDLVSLNRILEVIKVFFKRKFGIMISNDDESLVLVFAVPFPQRGNYVLAVYSAKRPHFNDDHLAAQVRDAERGTHIQPGIVC